MTFAKERTNTKTTQHMHEKKMHTTWHAARTHTTHCTHQTHPCDEGDYLVGSSSVCIDRNSWRPLFLTHTHTERELAHTRKIYVVRLTNRLTRRVLSIRKCYPAHIPGTVASVMSIANLGRRRRRRRTSVVTSTTIQKDDIITKAVCRYIIHHSFH
jgi:hypothetical protein